MSESEVGQRIHTAAGATLIGIPARQSSWLVELASGIDALYLSGRTAVPVEFIRRLDRAREEAEIAEVEAPIDIDGDEFRVQGHSFGKYRYKLVHEHGMVGVTESTKLPALRIQPRAQFLHGVGAQNAVNWFRDRLESGCDSAIQLSTSRLDLHADFQGWDLRGEDRKNFLCRSGDRVTYESGDVLGTLQFGYRRNKTLAARIYDKTKEIKRSGAAYWEDMWGVQFEPGNPVFRVEFEFGRQGLAEFGISTPENAIEAAGALWTYATGEWLTLRTPTGDGTKSRWPIAEEWDQVRRASIADTEFGLQRMYEGYKRGKFDKLVASLVGYVVSYAALFGLETVEDTCARLVEIIQGYCASRGLSFEKRVIKRRRELGLP